MRRALLLVGLIGVACGGIDPGDVPQAEAVSGAGGESEPTANGGGMGGELTVVTLGGAGSDAGGGGASDQANEGGVGGEATGGASAGYGGGTDGGSGGAGGASGSGGGASGSGGVGGGISLACQRPTNENVIDCDGLCGPPSQICTFCKFAMVDGYVELATKSTRTCPGITLKVASMTCARFTVQPGATASFTGAHGKSACFIVSGIKDGVGGEALVPIGPPSSDAWVRQESTLLVQGVCPLTCP